MADELDTLQFKASMNKTYDSNLFRRSNNEVAEQITTSIFGVKLDKTYSLQRFVLDISYVDNKYNENDYLDFAATNYNGSWLWSLTPNLTGTLSSQRTQSLNSFGDFLNTTRNIRTLTDNQFRAQYSPHKVWSLILGVSQASLENTETFTAISDFDSTGLDYGAAYSFPSGAMITFLGHSRKGEYKKRPLDPIIAFDNGYSEREYEVDLFLQDPGRSKLIGKIGYLEREYDNFTIRNYQSYVGYLNYDLMITGKIKSSFGLTRILAPFETESTAYSISDTVTAQISYEVTSKIQAGINLRYTERDFGGRGQFDSSRLDKEDAFAGFIGWNPTKNIGFSLRSTKSSRNSNVSRFNFDDTLTSVNIELKI
nr:MULTISPECIES: XrtB/PEP-CTERM-associated polysaccharide biosynthesis outer membrane protein EpsL [unclassified Methylophilus]